MGLGTTTLVGARTFMERVLLDSRATLLSIISKPKHSSNSGGVFGGIVSLSELAIKSLGAKM